MQQELRAANPDLNVELLGINRVGNEAFNPLVTAANVLPWLQDTVEQNVWTRWDVTYRDVRVLDGANRVRSVFNLTVNSLGDPQHYATLKQLLLDAAKLTDRDADRLPDDWEQRYLSSLSAGADDDPDGDGYGNFLEFAFGTDPTSAEARPALRQGVVGSGQDRSLAVVLQRRAGGMLDYLVEVSSDLVHWTAISAQLAVVQPPRILYDGTGTAEAAYTLNTTVQPQGFLRVRATLRP
jgi:hypothetical protein